MPINRSVLAIIADCWKDYPSEVPLPISGTGGQELLAQVLSLLAQEGVVGVIGTSVALTDSGYAAVEQAGRDDHRLSEFLRGRSLPAEGSASSSVVLAILRAHFEGRKKSSG